MNKVVHIITRFIKGGADFNTYYTLEGLSEDFECYLITGAEYDDKLVKFLRQKGVVTKSVNLKHFNPVSSLFSIFEIFFLLKKIRPRIVHTHSTEAGIVGRWAAWFANVPVIIHTNHGIPFNRGFFAKKILVLLERITAKITTKYISNANIITKTFLDARIGRENQYVTIYSGIDLEKIKKSKPDPVLNVNEKIKVLCASRLVEGKGLEDFIEVAKSVKKASNNFDFLIAGDGPLRNRLISQANNSVIFLGHRADLSGVMKACNLFVLPSYREGTPRVITEALACGLPVIATKIDGIPEQVQEGKDGFLSDPGDVALLKRLILEKEWKRIHPHISQKFSKEVMINEIKKLYSHLLG